MQSVQQPGGSKQSLAKYAGQVTLVVNVASQCGYTESNYRGLEELRRQFHPQGFEACGFRVQGFGVCGIQVWLGVAGLGGARRGCKCPGLLASRCHGCLCRGAARAVHGRAADAWQHLAVRMPLPWCKDGSGSQSMVTTTAAY